MNQYDLELIEAQHKVRKAMQLMYRKDVLDMKHRRFTEFRVLIQEAAVLMNKDLEVEQNFVKPFRATEVIEWFDKHYPSWRDLNNDNNKPCRNNDCVIPRHILRHLLAIRTGLTLEQIGELTGGADHTTVMHSRDKVNDKVYKKDPAYLEIYNAAITHLMPQKND